MSAQHRRAPTAVRHIEAATQLCMVRAFLVLLLVSGASACWSLTASSAAPTSSEIAATAATLTLDEVAAGDRGAILDAARPDAVAARNRDRERRRNGHALVDVAVKIDTNGPFLYRQDDSVFQNRERRLPVHPAGFWREYTVPTPGAGDRGARRLIGGDDHSLHYTRDHYRSFVQVRAANDDVEAVAVPQ